jgi:hypothetical protein
LVDEDLLNALGQGNIISVGPSKDGKTEPEMETLPNIELNVNIEQYNHPIGIDFAKSLPPLNYVTLSELLERILDLTNLSTECRFDLETYQNYILQGKIAELRNLIHSTEPNQTSSQKKGGKKGSIDPQLSNMVKFLLLFLEAPPKQDQKWLPREKFLTLIDKKSDIKKLLKEYRQDSTLSSEAMHYLLIIKTLLDLIQRHFSSNLKPDIIDQIQDVIFKQEFQQAEKIIKEKIGVFLPKEVGETNEDFVKSALPSFKFFLQ